MRAVLPLFAITYACTWACFFLANAVMGGPADGFKWPLLLLGSFAPSLVAIALTAREEGRPEVRALLRRLLQWRVGVRWYVFALGYMAAVKLVVAVTYRLGVGAWPRFGHEAWYAIVAAIVVAGLIGGPLGEEVGWRGYALPRLAERLGMARASVLLGVVWACWHLPLFFLKVGGDQFGQSVPLYVLQVTALSVAIAFLFQRTGGSVLLAALMHSAVNQTKDLVPSITPGATNALTFHASTVGWLTVTVLWIAGAWFLTRMGTLRAANRETAAAAA